MIVSAFGLAGLLYTLRLTRKAARAAVDAVEAQVSHERPVMQISSLAIRKARNPKGRSFQLEMDWFLSNQGKSGCWLEKVCVYPEALKAGARFPSVCDEKFSTALVAYVRPGKGWGITNADPGPDDNWTFTAKDAQIIRREKKIWVFGYSIYRDAGGRRWRTGFAFWMPLNDDFAGAVYHPFAHTRLWEDMLIPKPRWHQHIWDERAPE